MATEKLILEILKLHKIIRVFISLFVMIGLFFTKSMMPNVEILHVKESQIFCVYRRNGVNYEIYIIWKWCIWKSWM